MSEPPDSPKLPRPPAGLASRGRSLWRSVNHGYVLSIAELEVLTLAARCLDRIQGIEDELKDVKGTVLGSKGQPVAHPLAGELRAEVALAARLLTQLGLPTDEGETDLHGSWQGLTPSERGKKAAARRWVGRGHR